MKTRIHVAVLAALLMALASCERSAPQATPVQSSNVTVYFSPRGGCTEAVVSAIGAAKKSLDVQAYSFTSAPIAEAVAKAHERGVKVRVVLDKSQRGERYTSATYLLNHHVPTSIDAKHAIAHNKVMIIDGDTVITGSFNFTKAAEESNAENLLILRNVADLAAKYTANFEIHLGHSETYTAPANETAPPPQDN